MLINKDPAARYAADLESGDIKPDESQRKAVNEFQILYTELVQEWQRSEGLLFRLQKKILPARSKPIRGLYLWGDVGRGKTYLMDLFFETLPGKRKLRSHFHQFMRDIHEELKLFRSSSDPLQQVARKLARQIDVICFDEFYVSDIADAMILGTLFEELFSCGVVLVATSNIEPGRLYERGLQRERFLPAIALIKRHTKVMLLAGAEDYRLRNLQQAEIYHYPLDHEAILSLKRSFDSLATGMTTENNHVLTILGRKITAKQWSEGLAWFEFSELCGGPRSASDYIELAQVCHTIMLSDIPQLTVNRDDEARRFINLVDELYNHSVKFIVSAEVSLQDLYQGHNLAFAFQRTISRMLEMRTSEYLSLPHNPG